MVNVGSVAEFTCPICGYPLTQFEWETERQMSERMEKIGGLMVIRNVQLEDAGEYQCFGKSRNDVQVSFKWNLRVISKCYKQLLLGARL